MLERGTLAGREAVLAAAPLERGGVTLRVVPAATRFSLRVKGVTVPARPHSPRERGEVESTAAAGEPGEGRAVPSTPPPLRRPPHPAPRAGSPDRLRPSGAPRLLDLSPQAGRGWALDLPVNRFATAGDRLLLRLGPDEWLALGSEDDVGLASDLAALASERFHALVAVSHRQVAMGVAGWAAADVLNAGCPLDLHPSAFPVGAGTRTLLGKAEVVLLRTAPNAFRVEPWRSFAAYVHAFLAEAMRDL